MKKLLFTLVAICTVSLVFGQNTSENYIKNTTYKIGTTTGNIDDSHKLESITYFDGLGRPKQSIAVEGGGNKEDIITPTIYDEFGRQMKTYLPYSRSNSSLDYEAQDNTFFTTLETQYITKFPDDITALNPNPYSESHTESSPLGRALEQGAPGADWALDKNSDTDHTIKFDYQTNSGNEVKHFVVSTSATITNNVTTYTPTLSLSAHNSGYYPANELSKVITKNENWTSGNLHTTEEFKDKQGRVILKRTYGRTKVGSTTVNDAPHDTYYAYDEYGNLSYVLPPKVEASTESISNILLRMNDLLYQYVYDDKNRLVQKRIPGKQWEKIVYDKLDRPILTSGTSWWYFTKYDAFGRVAYTGTANFPSFVSREYLQSQANIASVLSESTTGSSSNLTGVDIYYTNNSYPTDVSYVSTINYYDDYIDEGAGTSEDAYGVTPTTNVKGLPTVSKVRVLDTGSPAKWITTATYYDEKVRPIYVYSHNEYLETTDKIKSKLDFLGNVLESTSVHQRTGHHTITTIDRFSYDHMGRLLAHEQEIDGVKSELIARNKYDELGQLKQKLVGGDVPIISEYQNRYGLTVYNDGSGRIVKWAPVTQNAGLSTFESFTNNGYVSFKATYDYKDLTVGLSYSDTDYFASSIDYAINLGNDGTAQVYEKVGPNNVVPKGSAISYNAGDRFKIEVRDNTVYYMNNGEVFYVSTATTNGNPLYGDAAFTTENGMIENFIIVNTDVALQTVDYSHNIRGWLKEINDTDNLQDDLFSLKLNYNTRQHYNDNGGMLYNGNIAEAEWRTANLDNTKKWYTYSYDGMNRMRDAMFSDEGLYKYYEYCNYDKNGNITYLGRFDDRGYNDPMDNLNYTYDSGNKLLKVTDSGDDDLGFIDGTNTGDDYRYDANGNMVMDLNKGIGTTSTNGITYNHFNLPTSISVNGNGNNGTISYIYDATGVKLEKKVSEGGNDVYTHYAGNYIYQTDNTGSSLKFFNHPEGYIEPSVSDAYNYIYQYKDHLGNVRLSYKGKHDLVFYDGFESSSGWGSNGINTGIAVQYDANFAHADDTSGKLTPYGTNSYQSVSYNNSWINVSNPQNTDYIISGWVYLEDVSSSNIAYIYLMSKNSSNTVFTRGSIYTNIKGEWVYLEKRVTIPSNTTGLNFKIANYYAGDVWFDNLTIRKATDNPDLEILEENNYYPYGLKHEGYNDNPSAFANPALKWKYNGVEYEESLGLNLYEMDVRSYDPTIARFTSTDPVTHHSMSTYMAFDGNPAFWADPSGADANANASGESYYYADNFSVTDQIWNEGRYVPLHERGGITHEYMQARSAEFRRQRDMDSFIDEINEELNKPEIKVGPLEHGDPECDDCSQCPELCEKLQAEIDKWDHSSMALALTISGGLLADDVTAIGVIDDAAIPFVWTGLGMVWIYDNSELIAKQLKEINNILEKNLGGVGMTYELRATESGSYPIMIRGKSVAAGYTHLNKGDVWKYGETTKGFSRYTLSELARGRLKMVPIFYGTVAQIKVQEKIMIYGYALMHGHRPPGNKIWR